MKKTLIAAVMAGCAGAAAANFLDGNKLLDHINNSDPAYYGVAVGYLMGVHDVADGDAFCSPGAIKAGQLADMVKNDLRAHPEIRHLAADVLVRASLAKAWPCAKKSSNSIGRAL